jgi:hypothetical protein
MRPVMDVKMDDISIAVSACWSDWTRLFKLLQAQSSLIMTSLRSGVVWLKFNVKCLKRLADRMLSARKLASGSN